MPAETLTEMVEVPAAAIVEVVSELLAADDYAEEIIGNGRLAESFSFAAFDFIRAVAGLSDDVTATTVSCVEESTAVYGHPLMVEAAARAHEKMAEFFDGFDGYPAARRAEAELIRERGWPYHDPEREEQKRREADDGRV